jgi:biotin synthase-like enzyme
MAQDLIAIGVYPFIVPFVPITGTPLESHPLPRPSSWHRYWARWRICWPQVAGGGKVKAGCARCGACSALSTFEKLRLPAAQVA